MKEDEVWDTICKMPNGKAPTLDGFLVDFYKSFWDFIKRPFMMFINHFLASSNWKRKTHERVISFIPMKGRVVQGPSSEGDPQERATKIQFPQPTQIDEKLKQVLANEIEGKEAKTKRQKDNILFYRITKTNTM